MKKFVIPFVIVLGFAAVSFTVFSRGGEAVVSSSTKANTLQSAAQEPVGKNLAPDFSLPTLDGGTITLSEYRGKKPVILDFWASWCPNCRRNMPKLNDLYVAYKDRMEVIGVNLAESENIVRKFIAGGNISFPIVLDAYGTVARLYKMNYTNVHVLINKDGNLVKVLPGDISESDVLSLLQ